MVDVTHLSDENLDELQNAAYLEKLGRLERRGGALGSVPTPTSAVLKAGRQCDPASDKIGGRAIHPPIDANSGCGQASPPSFAPPRTIGWAIKQLHNGRGVTRAGWNGRGQWVGLQLPDRGSMNTLPYLYIRTVSGDRVPWIASQTDLLAADWQLAP